MFDDYRFETRAKMNAAAKADVELSFPGTGIIRVKSAALFAEPDLSLIHI